MPTAVGKAYAEETAAALHGVADHVQLCDLSTVWPEIPEHGDISDLIAHLGRSVMLLVTNTFDGICVDIFAARNEMRLLLPSKSR